MRILSVAVCCGLLAGCSSGNVVLTRPPASSPNCGPLPPAALRAGAFTLGSPAVTTYAPLYSFKSAPDGASPRGMVEVNGVLYGITYSGGRSGYGTVFGITTSGAESVLHDFRSGPDGANPLASLVADPNGALYGTTANGGANNAGIAFRMNPPPPGYGFSGWTQTILHSFGNGTDGAGPNALIDVNGVFYGTTYSGGAGGYGTVFKMSPSGAESVLYSFKGATDGANPQAGVVDVHGVRGMLYGTTANGGVFAGGAAGCGGTIFEMSMSGAERVVHSFGNGTDGAYPVSGLTVGNGLLYGTTYLGGASNAGSVFWFSVAGTESVIYNFTGTRDGGYPFGGLAIVNGTLYGTTVKGGRSGYGTVFAATTTGAETVLHDFSGPDGAGPTALVADPSGALYGTTTGGGTLGFGTVFQLAP